MRRRLPRVSTVRLVVLVGIVAALFGMEAFEVDIFPRWRDTTLPEPHVASPQRGKPNEFTLCESAHQRSCVVDGDTIRYGGLKIRLVGIDTPEIHDFKCTSELDRGRRARDRLLELMNAGPFEIVYKGGPDEDMYGRKLRGIERDGRSLGDVLVAEGLARRWDGARRGWCG